MDSADDLDQIARRRERGAEPLVTELGENSAAYLDETTKHRERKPDFLIREFRGDPVVYLDETARHREKKAESLVREIGATEETATPDVRCSERVELTVGREALGHSSMRWKAQGMDSHRERSQE